MLITIGRGLSPAASPTFTKKLFFSTALPNEVTFTRTSKATYINEKGELLEASADQPRFNHDEHGNKLGLMIEPPRINKCVNYNVNPTSTTGMTTSGDANGVLSVVNDSSALINAGLDKICTNGNVYFIDNTQGTGSFVVYCNGGVGNFNPHSFSLYARSLSAGLAFRIFLGDENLDIDGNASWQRYKLENQTPDIINRKLKITVPSGKSGYFILNQVEESSTVTSVITTQGASASRAADRAYITELDTYDWFDETQGFVTCRYSLSEEMSADAFAAVIHSGSTANTVGLRIGSSSQDARAYVRSGGANVFTSSTSDKHIPHTLHAAGIRWNGSEAEMVSGGLAQKSTISQAPSGLNRLEIGARNGGISPIHGHIQSIEIGKNNIDLSSLGQKLQTSNDLIIASAGQSLIRGHFISQETGSDLGKQKHREILGQQFREQSVVLVNGGLGASAAVNTSNSTSYWWNLNSNTQGPAFDFFLQEITNSGIKPTMILWGQGEEDSHKIGNNTSINQYKHGLESIFSNMRTLYGDIPIFIQRIGRRTSFSNTGGIQAIREIQQEIIDENSWCYEAGEIYDLGLTDSVHLDDAGYVSVAERNALRIISYKKTGASESIKGPEISSASRSGLQITVTLAHSLGDDFTPNSNIDGFAFFDNSGGIAIASATRVNSETISITLTNTPSGIDERLCYGFDDMAGITLSNVIRDNSSYNLPLQTTTVIL